MKSLRIFATIKTLLSSSLIFCVSYGQDVSFQELQQQADAGNVDAQVTLGIMYINGEGAKQDYSAAEFYFRLASEQGDSTAQNNLGWMYLQGLGVTRDYAKAEQYFLMAAEQGLMLAQANLGSMFSEEVAVQDRVKGHMWLSIAAANGNTAAGKKAWLMEVMMSQDQIAEAERLAKEWLEGHKKETAEDQSDPEKN